MNAQQFEQMLILEDYLKRYIANELNQFKIHPPTNNAESELQRLFSKFFEFINLNDDYNSEVTQEISYLNNQIEHINRRARALQKLCRIYGIDTTNISFNKNSDY